MGFRAERPQSPTASARENEASQRATLRHTERVSITVRRDRKAVRNNISFCRRTGSDETAGRYRAEPRHPGNRFGRTGDADRRNYDNDDGTSPEDCAAQGSEPVQLLPDNVRRCPGSFVRSAPWADCDCEQLHERNGQHRHQSRHFAMIGHGLTFVYLYLSKHVMLSGKM